MEPDPEEPEAAMPSGTEGGHSSDGAVCGSTQIYGSAGDRPGRRDSDGKGNV